MERDYTFLDTAPRGIYAAKKVYDHAPLPKYEEVHEYLPKPFIEALPEWRSCYEYAIKVLYRNTHEPKDGSGYVSNFVDAAFNKDIFLWDTCFMTMFCNLLHKYIPGICSLDNFYIKQFEDGEIPRELVRDTGKDFLRWVNAYDVPLYSFFHRHYAFRGLAAVDNVPYEELYNPDLGRKPKHNPYLTLDNLNHPILAFAEWESFLQTGDVKRLADVIEPLYHYYDALYDQLRHVSGLFVTDWASMDNSTRNKDLFLGVDISSEMVLFAKHLILIMDKLAENGLDVKEYEERRKRLEKEKTEISLLINRYMWDEESGFYYDLDKDMKQIRIKTAAAFWTMISGVADEKQMDRLCWYLEDKKTFNRLHRVPVLAADEPGYDGEGDYWRGSVWAPMNTMIVRGLEERGRYEKAREIALNDCAAIFKVFCDTGTIWENYPADYLTKGQSDHPDMVGWSGMAPISFYIRYGVGLVPGEGNTLNWYLCDDFLAKGEVGCADYYFNDMTVSLSARAVDGKIEVSFDTDKPLKLVVISSGINEANTLNGKGRFIYG